MPLFDAITRAATILAFEFLFVFIIGHAGLLNPALLGISVFATLGALIYTAISRTHEFLEESRVRGPGAVFGLSATEAVLAAFCIIAALSTLPLALTPPTVRDELIQHLTMPRLYLERGAIYETPFMGFSYLPGNAGLLYLATMALGSDIIPRVVHWGFGILTGLLVYGYLSHRAGRVAALLGFLFFVSTPVVINLSRMAYIDLASTFFATLSILSVLFWKDGFKTRWLVYSAVGMGLALGTKYSTIPAFLLVGCFVPYIYIKKTGRVGGAVKSAVIFGVVTLLVLSPWLVRNWLWAGNPLYPLVQFAAASVGGGDGVHVTGGLSPIAKRFLLYNEGVVDVLLLPLRIFWEGVDNSIEHFDGVLNVLFLPLLVIGLVRRRMLDAGYLAIFAILVCCISMLTVDVVVRYLLPGVVAVVVVSASGASGLLRDPIERRTWVRVAGGVLVAVFLIINAVYVGRLYAAYQPWGFLTGAESRDAYLARVVPDYAAVTEANRVLPKDVRVYMIFTGERTYYWDRDFYYGDRLGGQFKAMVMDSIDSADLTRRLINGLGVTHIFTKEELLERFLNDNFEGDRLRLLAEFFNGHTRRVVNSGGFVVFEIT